MTTTNRTTQGCVPSGKALETDWKPVVEDFNRQNASPQRLSANLQLDVPYILVERDRVDRLFNVDGLGGWGRFYTLYPNSGGYIEVSAVGFDEAKTRAMVYVAHHCGGLCGAGTYHFLEKTDEAWRPATLDIKNCRWVS
jgi:hypothetical protein